MTNTSIETRQGSPSVHPHMSQLVRGVLLVLFVGGAAVAVGAQPALVQRGVSALTLAIVFGMLLGNTVYRRWAPRTADGVNFAKHWLLRAGIVLYGLRLSFQDISDIGVEGVLIDAVVIGTTFLLACVIGVRWLGLERNAAALIGSGAAICGAAAVMGTQSVIRASSEQVSVAVATVVTFGTLSMLLVPFFGVPLAIWLGGDGPLGVYVGSTLHEVAQVVAAAGALGADVSDAAVITKMVRVMMLAPFLIALALLWRRSGGEDQRTRFAALIPWFALGFCASVVLSSYVALPPSLLSAFRWLDQWLLSAAMVALGLGTQWRVVHQAGVRPMALAALLWMWLLVGGAVINKWVGLWGG